MGSFSVPHDRIAKSSHPVPLRIERKADRPLGHVSRAEYHRYLRASVPRTIIAEPLAPDRRRRPSRKRVRRRCYGPLRLYNALAIAQTVGTNPVDNVDTNAATFGSSTTSGSLVVVLCYGWRAAAGFDMSAAGAVADNKSNTYTRVDSQFNLDYGTSIHYCANVTGGASHQITIDPAGTGNYFSWLAFEVTGAATTTPLDQQASANGPNVVATGNLGSTTVQNDEIEFAVLVAANSSVITVDAVSPAYIEDSEQLDGVNHVPGEIDHRILTATTNVGASWTVNIPPGRSTAQAATFKQAAAGTAVSDAPPPQRRRINSQLLSHWRRQ